MVFFRSLIQHARKITFRSPKRSGVVIFDPSGSDLFIKLIIPQNVEYSLLYSRFEIIHISPAILIKIAKNFFILRWEYKNFYNYIFCLYFYSCLEYINPKVVITYIDNSIIFHWLSRTYPNSLFYAVQNGSRTSIERNFSLPNFICFGQNEIDHSKTFGHTIDNFFPVGSLKGSFFRYTLLKKPQEKEYDICLISQYRYSIMVAGEYPDFKNGLELLELYLKRFIEKNSLKFCVALHSENTQEYEYFSRTFENKAILIRDLKETIDGTSFSTYFTLDKSKVVVTLLSTVGVEAFGWGEKVLFCNFTGNEIYDLDCQEIYSINISDYDVFEQKLLTLLHMDNREYLALTHTSRAYMMNYNPDLQVHEFIKKLISDAVSSKK